jgi:hypothetical protein
MRLVFTRTRKLARLLSLTAVAFQLLATSACGGCSGTPAEFATFAWDGSTWKQGQGEGLAFLAMAYDPDLNSVVGLDESGATWKWAASRWQSLQANSCCPEQVTAPTLVYDYGAGRLLLFSGNNYKWSGSAWERFGGLQSPATATYDRATKQLVGIDGDGNTLLFDGTRWNPTNAAQMPVWEGSIVYDAARKQVVGIDYGLTTGSTPHLVTWDGTSWSRSPGVLPFSTFSQSGILGYDTVRQVVLIGSEDSLLAWDGSTLSRLPGDAPGGRTDAAFDEHAGQLLWQKQTKDPTGNCF